MWEVSHIAAGLYDMIVRRACVGGEACQAVGVRADELRKGVLWGQYGEEVVEGVNGRGLEAACDAS